MRTRRPLAAAAALVAVASTTAATGRAELYDAPRTSPVLSAAPLDARYAAVRRDIEAARTTAARVHDGDRSRALSAFLTGGRRFLSFDARGGGRAVEVFGDLATADRVAVVVPGADGRLTNFDSWKWAGGGARALHRQAGGRLAVVAWLGYASPSTLSPSVLTPGRATGGARELGRFVTGLHTVNGRARVALLCHSYGTVVCAKTASRLGALPVDAIALYGSPGVPAASAADLKTTARVWAARSDGDWTEYVPKVRFLGLGLGDDPVARSFGARRFDAGSGTHAEYLKPGSRSLHNLALIAQARDQEVPHA
ncbi:alpha/beta hydrolase [Spirillospora sp. CA-294931]|uniref:alpha/beta hydrolase n=1 Tax=Spirillospora sp. CA-294931 TaxID=3240042 RepID=UPI003D9477F7